MDASTERQLKQLARKFLPAELFQSRIFQWLKRKFKDSQNNQQNTSTHQQQSYSQQQQYSQPQYGQPQYNQPQYNQQNHQPQYNQQNNQPHYNQQNQYPQPHPQQTAQQTAQYPHPQNNQHHPNSHEWNQSGDAGISPQAADLRNRANEERRLMESCFDRAHKAHENQDGAAAKDLSDEGHRHQAQRDQLNRQAADEIFRSKNASNPIGTIDLHGLYVNEAIDKTEESVQACQAQGLPTLCVIVGKGIHSTQHVAKIKPAIEDLMQKYRLSAHIDPHNTGRLIVDLTGAGSRDAGFVHDVARQMPGSDDNCVIA